MMGAHYFLHEELANLRQIGGLRTLRDLSGQPGPVVNIGGRQALMFCSNNYLGLANDERVKEAARDAITRYGTGATGSRLISGNSDLCDALETELAAFKGAEAALVFSSGYHANIGVIPALAGRGDVIFSDELNHASIIDGCRLSAAEVCVYRHRDVAHLAELLQEHRSARRKLIITESVFSMDGDLAPLGEICDLAQSIGAILMVDEAHGTGVFGPTGAGVVEQLGLAGKVDVQMGTFSKALGSLGGYVAGSRELVRFLINRARSFIFTTALPPAVLAASREALRLAQAEKHRRETLVAHARRIRSAFQALGLQTGPTESQIIPVVIGTEQETMAACRLMLRHGIFVQGIRPPTVPAGTARLRLAPMATHTGQQIDTLLRAFEGLAGLLSSRRQAAATAP